jgi:hypothetical protein
LLKGAADDHRVQVSEFALQAWSTAMQKEALAQETELRRSPGSMLTGFDQDEPFQVSAFPS